MKIINEAKWKEWSKVWGTYGLVIMIGFIMLGFVGLIMALGITVIAPMAMAMIPASNGKATGKWDDLSGTQKGAVGTFLGLMLPFLGLLLVWSLMSAVSYWVDLIIIVPMVLIVLYLYYTKFRTQEERQSNIFGRIFSNKLVGLIGFLMIMGILIFAVYSYSGDASAVEYEKPASQQVADYNSDGVIDHNDVIKLVDDGYTGFADNATVNTTLPSTLPTGAVVLTSTDVRIRIVDAYMQEDTTGQPIPIDFYQDIITSNDPTLSELNYTVGRKVYDGYGLPDVKVTLTIGRWDSTETDETQAFTLADAIEYSDSFGVVVFKNLTKGTYPLIMSKAGYQDFETSLVVTDTMIENPERFDDVYDYRSPLFVDYTASLTSTMITVVVTVHVFPTETFVLNNHSYPDNSSAVYTNTTEGLVEDVWDAVSGVPTQAIDFVQGVTSDWGGGAFDGLTGVFKGGGNGTFGFIDQLTHPFSQFVNTIMGGGDEDDVEAVIQQGYYYELAEGHSIYIEVTVVGGMQANDLKQINRQDSWYRVTGITQTPPMQTMFKLKNQMQSVYNSYFTAMQSVIPMIQNATMGATKSMSTPQLEEYDPDMLGNTTSYNFLQYKSNTFTSSVAVNTLGQSIYLAKIPTANSARDRYNPTQIDSSDTTNLVIRTYAFAVWGADEGSVIQMNFKTVLDDMMATEGGDIIQDMGDVVVNSEISFVLGHQFDNGQMYDEGYDGNFYYGDSGDEY